MNFPLHEKCPFCHSALDYVRINGVAQPKDWVKYRCKKRNCMKFEDSATIKEKDNSISNRITTFFIGNFTLTFKDVNKSCVLFDNTKHTYTKLPDSFKMEDHEIMAKKIKTILMFQ